MDRRTDKQSNPYVLHLLIKGDTTSNGLFNTLVKRDSVKYSLEQEYSSFNETHAQYKLSYVSLSHFLASFNQSLLQTHDVVYSCCKTATKEWRK